MYCAAALDRASPIPQQLIAQAIGVQPQAIWPSRYNARGAPKKLHYSAKAAATLQAVMSFVHDESLAPVQGKVNAKDQAGV